MTVFRQYDYELAMNFSLFSNAVVNQHSQTLIYLDHCRSVRELHFLPPAPSPPLPPPGGFWAFAWRFDIYKIVHGTVLNKQPDCKMSTDYRSPYIFNLKPLLRSRTC